MNRFYDMNHDEIGLYFGEVLERFKAGGAELKDLLVAIGIVQACSCPDFLNAGLNQQAEDDAQIRCGRYHNNPKPSDPVCVLCVKILPEVLKCVSVQKGDDLDE